MLILDSESLTLVKALGSRDGSPVVSLAWDPEGSRIALGSKSGIQIFSSHSGEILQDLRGHEGETRGIDWTPDGRRLASAGADRMIRVWDVETGLVALTIQASREVVNHLDWSPDGTRLITSDPRVLSIWDGRERVGGQ